MFPDEKNNITMEEHYDNDEMMTTESQQEKEETSSLTTKMEQQIKKYHYQSPKLPQKKYDGQNLQSLIYHKKWDQCISRITSHPHETTVVDKISGDLALHEACQSGAPFNVIQHLIHTNQSALSTKGFCGRIPLHYAVYVRPTVNVIKLLLRYYKDGAAVFDNDGRLPIHMAVLRNAPNLVIQVLIDANLRGLISCNKFGNTPGMVCNNDLVKALLEDEKQKKDSHLYKEEDKIRNGQDGSQGVVVVVESQGTIKRTKDQNSKEHDNNDTIVVPLKDVTVTSDYNKMERKDEPNEKNTTRSHDSTQHDVDPTHTRTHTRTRQQTQQTQQTQKMNMKTINKNLIVPTKGSIYRQNDNNNRIQRRSYEIPTPEQLIAWQFSSTEEDDAN